MKIGLVYPQTEYGSDPVAIRDYVQIAEGLGFSHILAYDHVLGANPDRLGGWQGVYTYQSAFHEPLVLFSYMAGFTHQIGFATGIIILPQRQTALFAKQAATLDVLSSGRLRVGVGLGWNQIEYTALNENFHNRGKRIEEQVTVLRKLWMAPLVDFSGRWHTIQDAGINPLPVQQPIPVWFGGTSEPALRRMAKIADGWMINRFPRPIDAQPALDIIRQVLEEEGRSRSQFGIEARMAYGDGDADVWTTTVKEWQEAGATHISLNTMGAGFDKPDKHLAALRLFADAIGL